MAARRALVLQLFTRLGLRAANTYGSALGPRVAAATWGTGSRKRRTWRPRAQLDYVGLPVTLESDLGVWSMPSMQFSDHCPLYGTLTATGPPLRAVRSPAFRLTGWCPRSPEDGRRYRRGLANALLAAPSARVAGPRRVTLSGEDFFRKLESEALLHAEGVGYTTAALSAWVGRQKSEEEKAVVARLRSACFPEERAVAKSLCRSLRRAGGQLLVCGG